MGRLESATAVKRKLWNSETQPASRDVALWVVILIALGVLVVSFSAPSDHKWVAFMWAGACLVAGGLVGFLFGIPRTLQNDRPPGPANTSAGNLKTTATAAEKDHDYRLLVNTNLEQISDWLTKILVGLGLTQLKDLPGKLSSLAKSIALGLNQTDGGIFARALIIYFTGIGFLGGYLLTRLFLAIMFYQADRGTMGTQEQSTVIDSAVDVEDPGSDQKVSAAVKQVSDVSFQDLKSAEDFWAWAKAQLLKRNFSAAVDGYRSALRVAPENMRIRTEYAVALFYLNRKTEMFDESLRELLEVYARLSSSTSSEIRQQLYEALTYIYLYVEPSGYDKAIQYGEEYLANASNTLSAALLVNLASAYGQRYRARRKAQAPQQELDTVRARTLDLVKQVVKTDPSFKQTMISLLVHNLPGKDPNEDDLESFELDPDFRTALGLPV